MAIDVCSEVVSPRISFSHDLKESADIITPVQESHPLISTVDFDFCITTTDQIFFSSADELFSNGKILPFQLKKTTQTKSTTTTTTTPALENGEFQTKRHMLKELISANTEEEKPPTPTKTPFWQIKRSRSENGRGNSLIRSLQFLSRSNSTGSAQNHKPYVLPRPIQSQNSKPSSSSSCSRNNHSHPLMSSSKKSSSNPLKKSGSGRSYGNIRISPVLNIPPAAYISKATLFGLTSFFCNAKSKKKKK